MGKRLIFTLETNGLLKDVKVIYFAITLNLETKELKYYKSEEINLFIKELEEAEKIIGHNIINYHIQVIKKLYPNFKIKHNQIIDSYLLSKLLYRDLEKHSLNFFAEKFKIKVPFVSDYSKISEELKNKSKTNIKVLYKLYTKMLKDMETQNITDKLVELEMTFASIIEQQNINGFLFDIDLAKKIHVKLVSVKNEKQLNILSNGKDSLIHSIREDNRISGQIDTLGTKTGRCTHFNPNLSGVPKVKHLRSLFKVPQGKKLLGVDASNLELRLLAHYMKDLEYIKTVESGDIHELNRLYCNLDTRDEAKSFIYSFLYGAGNKSLGKKIKPEELNEEKQIEIGKTTRENFLNKLPNLNKLKEQIELVYKERGYIKSLEGRNIIVDSDYKLLNALLQTSASDIMKRLLVILENLLSINNVDFLFVLNVHDEIQIETNEVEKVEYYCHKAFEETTKYYKLRCKLKGNVKIGDNWWETH